MSRFIFRTIAIAFLASPAASALAQTDAASPASPELAQTAIYAYGAGNPDCLEWTNACQVCKRDDSGTAQCSTSGIACVPGEMVCRATRPKP